MPSLTLKILNRANSILLIAFDNTHFDKYIVLKCHSHLMIPPLQLGPFDMAAIPIGAYQPNWFMKYQHVHPGEAVEIHKDIKSKKSLGIHWGTFMLTTEYYLEPPVLLTSFMNRYTPDILY